MQLAFFLGNDLIEAVSLEDDQIPVPGYLGTFKRTLKEKYNDLIQSANSLPEFLIMPKYNQQHKHN